MAARKASPAPPPGPVAVIAVERELDALFQVPLEGFVAARNALAARLKAAGRPDEAAAVKALAKPAATAWALNQVHWTERALLDALAAAGQRLLGAQRAGLAGRVADMAGAARARQAAVDAVVDTAVQRLVASGAAGGLDARRRLAASADALAARGEAALTQEPRPGRLTADLDPPGFAVLAALAGAMGAPPEAPGRGLLAGVPEADAAQGGGAPSAAAATTRAIDAPGASGPQPPRRVAIDAATREVAAAETALERAAAAEFAARESLAAVYARRLDASRAVEAATAALAEAQRRVEATRGDLATADLALARARAEADPLERSARDAAAARERAAAALAAARTRLDSLWSNVS